MRNKGAYKAEVSQQHPTLVVFLVEQSEQMKKPSGGVGKRKVDEAAEAVDSAINSLVMACMRSTGVYSYFDLAVLGYRTSSSAGAVVETAWRGALADRRIVGVPEVANSAAVVEQMQTFFDDESGETLTLPVQKPYWMKRVAAGGAPMCAALQQVTRLCGQWISTGNHHRSYPPVVVHISGSESTDGDPVAYADELRQLKTDDGHVLLYNGLLTDDDTGPLLFPADGDFEDMPANQQAKKLFQMSSEIPATGIATPIGARGLSVNAITALRDLLLPPSTGDCVSPPALR